MKIILIVEDESTLSNALSKKIEKEGFEVEVAKDGILGLSKLEKKEYDLILLDILMPNMNGLTMLDKMRETTNNKDVPVIVLSNLEDPSFMAQAMELGSLDYLVKSDWSLEDIILKIKEKIA